LPTSFLFLFFLILMIYFSEIKGKKVATEDQIKVGVLEDVIFKVTENPLLTKLVIRGVSDDKLIVPIEFLDRINNSLTIKKNFRVDELEENELFLMKNLLDKQIIDLKGAKIIRVNDIAIQDKGKLCVMGVDVGILGILRWLKLEKLISRFFDYFKIKLTSDFLSWGDIQPLELARGSVKLKIREEKLKKIRPEDLADYLEKTNIVNARKLLKILDEKQAAEVMADLNLNYQLALFHHYRPEKAAELLSFIDPDEAVDILLALPRRKREEIIKNLPEKEKKEFDHLLRFSTTPLGNLMTSEYLTISSDNLVKEVIDKIKNATLDFSFLYAVYVLNKEDQLVGVFSPHELLIQELDTPVYKFMVQNVIVVHLTTPAEIAIKKMLKYQLNALPLIDENKKLLGIITFDDLTELILGKIR
jgi:CBS domain-containing protein/sporulation protein YlmC with PRC-barrel domain